jgi:hypothetical protein
LFIALAREEDTEDVDGEDVVDEDDVVVGVVVVVVVGDVVDVDDVFRGFSIPSINPMLLNIIIAINTETTPKM